MGHPGRPLAAIVGTSRGYIINLQKIDFGRKLIRPIIAGYGLEATMKAAMGIFSIWGKALGRIDTHGCTIMVEFHETHRYSIGVITHLV